MKEHLKEKKQEKAIKIQTNIKAEQSDLKDKQDLINKKWKNIGKKVEQATQKRRMFSMKHREIENLRFEDLNENLDVLKNQRFR